MSMFYVRAWFGVLVSVCCVSVVWASVPWYQVELYIITQNEGSMVEAEIWPDPSNLFLEIPQESVVVDLQSTVALDIAYQQLSSDKIKTRAMHEALKKSSRYRVLYAAAWRQPFYKKEGVLPIFIQGGRKYGDFYELEGVVKLHVARYLHIEAHLIMGVFDLIPAGQEGGYYTDAAAVIDPFASEQQGGQEQQYKGRSAQSRSAYIPIELYELKQSRRMRSGELHYLDHPRLAVLVQINRT